MVDKEQVKDGVVPFLLHNLLTELGRCGFSTEIECVSSAPSVKIVAYPKRRPFSFFRKREPQPKIAEIFVFGKTGLEERVEVHSTPGNHSFVLDNAVDAVMCEYRHIRSVPWSFQDLK